MTLTYALAHDMLEALTRARMGYDGDAYAPDATTTAERLVAAASNAYHGLYQSPSIFGSNTTYTFSVYLKTTTGGDWFQVWSSYSGDKWANFNVRTGVTGLSGGCTPSIQALGNGWFRCSITFLLDAIGTVAGQCYLMILPADQQQAVHLATGVGDYHVWGAQPKG